VVPRRQRFSLLPCCADRAARRARSPIRQTVIQMLQTVGVAVPANRGQRSGAVRANVFHE